MLGPQRADRVGDRIGESVYHAVSPVAPTARDWVRPYFKSLTTVFTSQPRPWQRTRLHHNVCSLYQATRAFTRKAIQKLCSMLNGEIRSQIDAIWNAFWSGGISNPLEVIEQITYLLARESTGLNLEQVRHFEIPSHQSPCSKNSPAVWRPCRN